MSISEITANAQPAAVFGPRGLPDHMDALVFTEPGCAQIQRQPVPSVRAGHVLIRTAYVGICGADASFYDGSSFYLRAGLQRYPFTIGHEWSGTVEDVAHDVTGYSRGDRVVGHNFMTCETCDSCRAGEPTSCLRRSELGIYGAYPGAASEFFTVPARVLATVPASMSLDTAVLAEPTATLVHAFARTGLRNTDRVAVIGTGTMGLIAVQIARGAGAEVEAIGVSPVGLAAARRLGARASSPGTLARATCTVVVEASGATDAPREMLRLLAPAGRGALVGIPHAPTPELDLAMAVLNNATISAVLSGLGHWDSALAALRNGTVVPGALLDSVIDYTSASAAFALLATSDRPRPKILLRFPGADSSAE